MKFCMPHWDSLKAAIEVRGLSALIAESGEKAISNIANEFSDGSTIDNFDPLMGAHNLILQHLMAVGGIGIFVIEGCPLCYANEMHFKYCQVTDCKDNATLYDKWIDNAADDMVQVWKSFGNNL